METHEDMAMRQHLRMVMSLLQFKPTQPSPSTTIEHSQYIFNMPPVEFIIIDFLKMKESDAEWISPPFYTYPHGYKLCLVVYPNGLYRGKGTHMSVFLGLLEGKYDNCLSWPMEVSVIVQLLNWREDQRHHEETVTYNSDHTAYNLVNKEGITLSPVFMRFIEHSYLPYCVTTNTEYLRDDCLRLNVAEVAIHPAHLLLPDLPTWQDSHNISQSVSASLPGSLGVVDCAYVGSKSVGSLFPFRHLSQFKGHRDDAKSVCEFTLSDFSKRKRMNSVFFSPPFYTHQHGYKLCLSVYANGYGDSENTHVSLAVILISGEYDDQLQWPFIGDVVVGLQNWKENKGHYKKTISIKAASGFDKVTEGVLGTPWGIQFIAHSSLPYNSTTKTEYLQQDCLRLRVYQVTTFQQ